MRHTGKKESKKEIFKKGKTNKVTENLLQGDSNPDPKNQLEQRGEFHISHDASRLISDFSPRWRERSRVSREIFNDQNFKM